MTGRDAQLRRLVLGTMLPGFVGTSVPDWVAGAYAAGLRAVCLYGDNVVDADQLAALCTQVRAALPDGLVAVDEEGGDVTRLHYRDGSPEPGNALLGRVDDLGRTRESAVRVAADLLELGINLDLAPCADINSADDNPVIGTRSFGGTADLVSRHTAAWVEGLQSAGVAACAKHFPGHGDTRSDSHFARPVVPVGLEVLAERELAPFAAAAAAGVASVMVAHLVVPAVDPGSPATFSRAVVQGLLRDRLGYAGVVVTDALDMAGASADIGIPAAAVRSLAAGCDLLCIGPHTSEAQLDEIVDAVAAAVERDELPVERVAEAAARVARLAAAYPLPGPGATRTAARPPRDGAALVEGFRATPAAHAWLAAPEAAVIVQVGSVATPAVGTVPWGPAAVGAVTPLEQVPEGAKVAVVGRAVEAGGPEADIVRTLREAGHRTVLVECGWPRGDVADLVTYGGSRAVGHALADLLLGRTAPDPLPSPGS